MDLEKMLRISVSADASKATLTLSACNPPPHHEGVSDAVVVLHAVEDLARAHAVTVPLMKMAIRTAAVAWMTNGKRAELVIATGRAPVAGADGRLVLVAAVPEQAPAPGARRVDPRNGSFVVNVKQGAVLARAIRAAPGVPGVTVTGVELAATAGKDVSVTVTSTVTLEDGPAETIYRAATSGIVRELSSKRIDVGDSVEINRDIDHSTGNIDAWGSVVVRGSVEPGFAVRARGDVTIRGTCESAFIQSGGDVDITGGVLGRSGVTQVSCAGALRALFVENAKIEAGGDVLVRDSVLNSRILSRGSIEVRGRGTVLTSYLAAARSIAAATFGSEARLATELWVGGDPIAWQRLGRLRRALKATVRASKKGVLLRGGGATRMRGRIDADRQAKLRRTAGQTHGMIGRQERMLAATLFEGGGPAILIGVRALPKLKVRLGPFAYEMPPGGLPAGALRVDTARGEITFTPNGPDGARR